MLGADFTQFWQMNSSIFPGVKSKFWQLDKSQHSSEACEACFPLPKEPFPTHWGKEQMAVGGDY